MTLPQGFSVYQPAPGAQLQFLPALGTRQLDDLISAYVPGPAAVKDKRATVSLDFLEHAHLTGQTFKFYAVAAGSPTASPSLDSAASSLLSASPVASSWDWSATASASSRSSMRRPASPPSRHRTAVSSLPGMKILTRDGRNVTNSASRGSKTKEQRDHAHLMRIIKACDSCRRRKIRCDPSHRKRGAQPQAQQPPAAKKPRVSPREQPPPPQPRGAEPPAPPADEPALAVDLDPLVGLYPLCPLDALFSSDPLFSFSGLEASDPWDEFIQFPPADCNFFLDPDNHLSPQSSASSAPSKVQAEAGGPQTSPQYLFGSASDYTDFNLYSPESTFSEDDRMLSLASSRSPSANQPLSECPPAGPGAGWVDAMNASGDNAGGADYFDLGRLVGRFGCPSPASLGPVVIRFPPGTVVVEPDGDARGNESKSPSAPAPDATGVASREPPAARVSSTASIRRRSESPSAVGQDYAAAALGHAQHGPCLSVLQEGALGSRLARPEVVHDEARDSPTGNAPASVSAGVDSRSTAVVPSVAESPGAVSPLGVASWPRDDCRVGLARVSAGQQPAAAAVADPPARSQGSFVDLAPSSLGGAAGPPGRLDASAKQTAVSTTQMALVVAAVAAVSALALCVCGWSARSPAHVLGAMLVLAAKATATVSVPESDSQGSTLWEAPGAVSRPALAGIGAGCRGRE